eukprot:gene765-948_t
MDQRAYGGANRGVCWMRDRGNQFLIISLINGIPIASEWIVFMALKPFSDTRPVAKMRVGMMTIAEKWPIYLPATYSFVTSSYLQAKFPRTVDAKNLCINGSVLPNKGLIDAIKQLTQQEILVQDESILAFWCDQLTAKQLTPANLCELTASYQRVPFGGEMAQLNHPWDIFTHNAQAIIADWEQLVGHQVSQPLLDPYTIAYGVENIFIEKGVDIKAAVLNATGGPIYIGKNAVIEERAVIQGPVAIGEGAQIKVGSCIRSGTTIGPYSKIGGEVSQSVIFGYSNKAHDGFLGHSVIGEWCNLGAGTITSNLRNDYGAVTLWDQATKTFVSTSLQFCGLFMGDYSKCGIHAMFNTGTVVGVSASLAGTGYFKRWIPSFKHCNPAEDRVSFQNLPDVLVSIGKMMHRRNKALTDAEKEILSHLFEEALHAMVRFSDILSHDQLKKRLIYLVNQQKVPHAQLFWGPTGNAALSLALAFVTYLHCKNKAGDDACGVCNSCRKMAHGNHPDVKFIFPIHAVKQGSAGDMTSNHFVKLWHSFIQAQPYGDALDWSHHVEVEYKQLSIPKVEVQTMSEYAIMQAFEATHKVIFIWLPEYLHPTAANAMLKILEDPPAATLFLFVSIAPEKLLVTLRSRLQQMYVPPFDDAAIAQFLIQRGGEATHNIAEVVSLSEGNLNKALKLLSHDQVAFLELFKSWLRLCYSQDFTKMMTQVDAFQSMTKESQKQFLNYITHMVRQTLLMKYQSKSALKIQEEEYQFAEKLAPTLDDEALQRLNAWVNEAHYQIDRNANTRLLFLNFSLQMVQLFQSVRKPQPVVGS